MNENIKNTPPIIRDAIEEEYLDLMNYVRENLMTSFLTFRIQACVDHADSSHSKTSCEPCLSEGKKDLSRSLTDLAIDILSFAEEIKHPQYGKHCEIDSISNDAPQNIKFENLLDEEGPTVKGIWG